MAKGIIGRKLGMTSIYSEDGKRLPVTVIEAGPCDVLRLKTKESDGYCAVQIGFEEKKAKRVKKPESGFFSKIGVKPKKTIRELRMTETEMEQYQVGQSLSAGIFKEGDKIDVIATSKGKGFQGGVKRWGWNGGPKSHGSMTHRRIGSIGCSAYPSRVFKGHHMATQMGSDTVTVQNLEIVKVDIENNILVIRGAVPGHINSIVMVKRAKKKFTPEADVIPEELLAQEQPQEELDATEEIKEGEEKAEAEVSEAPAEETAEETPTENNIAEEADKEPEEDTKDK